MLQRSHCLCFHFAQFLKEVSQYFDAPQLSVIIFIVLYLVKDNKNNVASIEKMVRKISVKENLFSK